MKDKLIELPDNIRVPLDEVIADLGYLFGRVAADGSFMKAAMDSTRLKLESARKAILAALQPPQPVRSVSDEQWGLIRKTLMYINAAHILGSDVSPKAVNEWRKWLTAALPENQRHAAIAQEKQS